MYPILFQITCHECFDFLLIQIANILKYNPNCGILIHFAKQMELTNEQIITILSMKSVYMNPMRLETHMYKVLTQIISNCIFSERIDFVYTVLLPSNCLFYKKGTMEYISQYDYGCYSFTNTNYSGKWYDCYRYKCTITSDMQIPNYSGQHEGVFMKKEMIQPLITSFLRFCPLEYWNYMNDTTEECFLPTGMNILFASSYKRGKPICLLRDRIKNLDIGTDNNYSIPQTIDYLTKLKNTPDMKINYVLDEPEDNHFFCFKRVGRSNVPSTFLSFFMD
jgi:hypothetical protein